MRRNDSRILVIGTAVVFEERLNGELATLLYIFSSISNRCPSDVLSVIFFVEFHSNDRDRKVGGGGGRNQRF